MSTLTVRALARHVEPVEGELAQQGMAIEPRLAVLGLADPDHALVGKGLEAVGDEQPQAVGRVDDLLGDLGVPPADEHREPPEDRLLILGQQVVAPGDRALSGSAGARAGRGRRRPAGRGSTRAARGWRPGRIPAFVAAASSMASGSPSRRLTMAPTAARSASVATASGRTSLARSTKSWIPASASSGGTWYSYSPATRRTSRLVTIMRSPGAARRISAMPTADRREELLKVVEDEQGRQRLETLLERPGDRHARFLADVERRGDRARDQVRIADRGQVDEPCPAREPIRDRRRKPEAEARLAGAAGSRQGQQSCPPKDVAQRLQVIVAADEVRRRRRQVRRRVDRPQRAIVIRDTRDDEQVDRPRLLEVLEASRAHGRQAQPVRDPAAGIVAGGLRDGDLPAVRGRRDPGRVVHVDADVVAAVAGAIR